MDIFFYHFWWAGGEEGETETRANTLDNGNEVWCHEIMKKDEGFFFLFMLLLVVMIAGIYIYLQKPGSVLAGPGYLQMMVR
ncbi:hypothetical protein HYS82_00595 [Candidatus Amesbacteria bacterium]|nr:hypothetical protein [Candidatus Amesbacteria bacterium]